MRVRVTIDDREREVDVNLEPADAISVSLDGVPVEADITRVPGGLLIKLGHRVYDVAVGGSAQAATVAAGAARATVLVETERARAAAIRRGGRSAAAQKELRSPMPGRIVKVLVAAGDEVAADQPIIVVEAMKMENGLRAVAACKIASVHVKVSDAVEGNALLVTFG